MQIGIDPVDRGSGNRFVAGPQLPGDVSCLFCIISLIGYRLQKMFRCFRTPILSGLRTSNRGSSNYLADNALRFYRRNQWSPAVPTGLCQDNLYPIMGVLDLRLISSPAHWGLLPSTIQCATPWSSDAVTAPSQFPPQESSPEISMPLILNPV
jgi:hypothetical protein